MTVILVIAACIIGVLSWAGVSAATSGVAGICFACLLAILARIYQAGEQHRDLLHIIAKKSIVPALLLMAIGCDYVPPPTAPTVTPPVIVVENPPPVIPPPTPVTLLLSQSPQQVYVGEGASLIARPISGDVRGPATYEWAFGDGGIDTTELGSAGHVYGQPGQYAASVRLTDRDGRVSTASKLVTVANRPAQPREPRPPTPGFEGRMTCTAGDVGDNTGCQVRVSYKGNALPPSAIQNVDWEWGDGEVGPGNRPAENHVYDVAGTYHVWAEITASTSDGTKTTSATTAVTIEP